MGNSKFEPNKLNTLLNIYVINSYNQIETLKFVEENQNKNENFLKDYKEYKHRFYGWNFYVYENNIDENKINQIRDKISSNNNSKNVILCFVPYVYDLHIIKSVAEIPILKECSEDEQPLLLFISSSKKKNMQYYRKIARTLNKDRQKYKIDELNITSFHFNEITFNNELVNELWQMTIYYNQIPSAILPMSTDDNNIQIEFDQNSFTLNFLLAGRNGTGKSTFINLLKGRKIAYQSNLGIAKTNIINEYIITLHKKPSIDEEILDNNINNNINIINDNNLIEENSEISSILINEENEFHFNKEVNFSYQIADTMGFSEDNKESEKLLKYIKEYNEESARQKDRIHCIIYFIDDANRYRLGSSKVIINFFKFIVRKKIKIFFVINFNNGQKHECKKHLLLSLKKQLTESEFDFLFEEDRSNIIELSLRQNDNVKPFGLNKLMAKLESYFSKFRMEISYFSKYNKQKP